MVTVRDEKGNILEERYYDANGKLTLHKNKYAMIRRTFNEKNKQMSIAYLDTEGRLTSMNKNPYAEIIYDYDGNGNKIRESFYDVNLRPVNNSAGKATTLWVYNQDSKVMSEAYYDADGNPKELKAGYASMVYSYNDDYTVQTIAYLDKNGAPAETTRARPYSQLRKTYDKLTNLVIKEEYLDADGKPTRNRSLVYGKVSEYDGSGRLVRDYTVDAQGNISSGKARYAITVYTYDALGKRTPKRYTADGRAI